MLKSGVPLLAHRSGLADAIALRYRGVGTIFMLHSVIEDDRFVPDQSMRCPVSRLEAALTILRARGITFVSLDEAMDRLGAGAGPPFAAFTFDDGFADNLTHALPVMERHEAPFTVYVATGMITGDIDAWWLGLAELVRRRDHFVIRDLGISFSCADRAAKIDAYCAVEAVIHRDYATLPAVKREIARAGIDVGALARAEGLSLDRLRRLASHPLVTIGAHGSQHINLSRAPASSARLDMAANRAFLEDALARPVRHFAYPFGNARACGPREAELARELGFRTAVTTRHGTVFPSHAGQPHALPRETLSGTDTPASLACKTKGFYRAIQSRLGHPAADMLAGTGAR